MIAVRLKRDPLDIPGRKPDERLIGRELDVDLITDIPVQLVDLLSAVWRDPDAAVHGASGRHPVGKSPRGGYGHQGNEGDQSCRRRVASVPRPLAPGESLQCEDARVHGACLAEVGSPAATVLAFDAEDTGRTSESTSGSRVRLTILKPSGFHRRTLGSDDGDP